MHSHNAMLTSNDPHGECTGARGTDHSPFSYFLFTNLFSIKFLYFFIISSLFPYFKYLYRVDMQFDVDIILYEY